MNVEGGTSLQNSCMDELRQEGSNMHVVCLNQWMSNCSHIHNFRYEQEHGPLQMVGPANLALEKIY